MLVPLAVGALAAAGIALLVLLALAPRLRAFDDRRARVGVLVAVALVLLVLPFVGLRLAQSQADRDAASLRRNLYAWLGRQTLAGVLARTGEPAPAELEIASDGGSVVVRAESGVLWIRRCVAGRLDPDGTVTVAQRDGACP